MHNELDLDEIMWDLPQSSSSVVPSGFSSFHRVNSMSGYVPGYSYEGGNKVTREKFAQRNTIYVSNDDLID